jgi:putative protein-disulfide isomerase
MLILFVFCSRLGRAICGCEETDMSNPTQITYLFDPFCGWCYGASPALESLVARPDFTIDLAPTGLFAGEGARAMDNSFASYAWANDQRIARLTGQSFSENYRRKVLGDRPRLFDSGPATLALTAVAGCAPAREFEALKAIQRARYVEGRDTTDMSVLSDVLRGLSLSNVAERLAAPDDDLRTACRRRVEAARSDMRRFGVDGVPALIVGEGEGRRLVRANALFGTIDLLVAGLRAA